MNTQAHNATTSEIILYIEQLRAARNANRSNPKLVNQIQSQINDWDEKLATTKAQGT